MIPYLKVIAMSLLITLGWLMLCRKTKLFNNDTFMVWLVIAMLWTAPLTAMFMFYASTHSH